MTMKKSVSRIIIPFILLLAQFTDVPFATGQVINTESFDSITFPPTGWTVTGGPQTLWVRRTVGTNPTCTTHSGAAMARFTVPMGPPGDQELMTSPVVNYSGASGSIPTVSLWIYRDGGSTAGDSLSIFVNTANSLTGATHIGAVARSRYFFLPHNEPSDGWYEYTFNVPVTFTTDTNYVLLNGTARGGENIYVDDISWTEYPVACTGNPVAGNVVSTDTLICGGSGSADLSLTGSNSGGGITFQWQSAPSDTGPWTDFGTSTSTINTGTITDSTYFRCYVTCINGSVADTSTTLLVQVSTTPSPVVTINLGTSINYCTGSAPLVFVASGASTYTWTPNIAINATGDTAMVSPASSNTYTVVGSNSAGCSASASIAVNVSTSPIVTATVNTDTICSGQSVNLHAFVQGSGFGIQFVWQPGNLNGPNQTVSPTTSTVYTVSATSGASGCSGYDSVAVAVNPSPSAGFTYTVNNMTYTFTDTSTGAITSWLWNFGDGNTDNTQNPVHTYASNGNYTVTLTVTIGNCTDVYSILIAVLSVEQFQLSNGSQIQLYPNPVTNITTIEFSLDETSVDLALINSLGQTVMNKTIYPSSGNIYNSHLDLSEFSAGTYVLQLRTKSENRFLPLVKN
jgi:PKD repeat protein